MGAIYRGSRLRRFFRPTEPFGFYFVLYNVLLNRSLKKRVGFYLLIYLKLYVKNNKQTKNKGILFFGDLKRHT